MCPNPTLERPKEHMTVETFLLPAKLSDWKVEGPMTLDEMVRRLLQTCASPNEYDRADMARYLKLAPLSILSRREVKKALEKLRHDLVENVRNAAAWSPKYYSQ